MNDMFRNITPVVKNLIIINVLMFIATNVLGDEFFINMAAFFVKSPFFEPWQIITHMFMHGGNSHLIMNMFALFFLGPRLENRYGSKNFIKYYLITGLGAFLLYQGVLYVRHIDNLEAIYGVPMVGASGAIFGILLAYGMTFPNDRLMLLFPPIPIKAKYFVMGYGAMELFLGIQNSVGDNTAHFAHLGGMLFGYILIKLWNKDRNQFQEYY